MLVGDALEHGRLVDERAEVGTGAAAGEHGAPLAPGRRRRGARRVASCAWRGQRADVVRCSRRTGRRCSAWVASTQRGPERRRTPCSSTSTRSMWMHIWPVLAKAAATQPVGRLLRGRRPRARSAGSCRRARGMRRDQPLARPARRPCRPVRGRAGEADVVDVRRSARCRPRCRGPRRRATRRSGRPASAIRSRASAAGSAAVWRVGLRDHGVAGEQRRHARRRRRGRSG